MAFICVTLSFVVLALNVSGTSASCTAAQNAAAATCTSTINVVAECTYLDDYTACWTNENADCCSEATGKSALDAVKTTLMNTASKDCSYSCTATPTQAPTATPTAAGATATPTATPTAAGATPAPTAVNGTPSTPTSAPATTGSTDTAESMFTPTALITVATLTAAVLQM